MSTSLPISNLVSVSVNLSPQPAQAQNISTLLVLGNSDIIDTVQRIRYYSTIAQVATDFGTSAPEYLAAVLWFEQAPQPTQLAIGRWAQTATHGRLTCAPLTVAQQAMSAWTAITAGSFHLNVDGGTAHDITGLNFSAATTLQGVAALIQTAVDVTYAGVTVTWNSVSSQFIFESGTAGALSAVTFLSTAASGTDISAQLGGTATSVGAYLVPGLAAETALAAATLFDANFGQKWYALMMPTITVDTDHVAVANYIQASNNKHLYGVTSSEATILSATDTTNIAYLLQQANLTRALVQYSSSNAYAVASLFGRILTVNYLANNTTITLMYKQEPGIVAETLNQTQMSALLGFNCNVFVAYNNSTAIIQAGTVANGNFIDTVTGTDWLALDIQTTIYNLLYTTPTKIPQTDAGTNILMAAIEGVCSQAVKNGLLGPGTWNTAGFGALNQGDFLPKGFYVYAPPLSTQNATDRAARKSVPFQIAAKLAGAVQTVNVIISVNP